MANKFLTVEEAFREPTYVVAVANGSRMEISLPPGAAFLQLGQELEVSNMSDKRESGTVIEIRF